jgi:hypothetical protein
MMTTTTRAVSSGYGKGLQRMKKKRIFERFGLFLSFSLFDLRTVKQKSNREAKEIK